MMKYEKWNIEKFNHDTILVQNGKVFYFDPYQIDMINMPRADVIFISHHHQDHCSPDDIEKIIKSDTMIIAAESCRSILEKFQQTKYFIKQGETFECDDFKLKTIPAYNINKFRSPGQLFHPKEDGGVGYVVEFEDLRLYFAGDTDVIPEMEQLENIDIACLPISGVYVMTMKEAGEAIAKISAKIIIPMHYGVVAGDRSQAEELKNTFPEQDIRILD
ncbi:MAG: MBL fold metallo-hydrolase [Candidatus Komeilibacteria bacterium]